MYECPNCGGNLKFDIPSQQLACAYCDTHVDPYDVDKETDAVETEYFETTIFTCPQCGGELYSADNEATSFCSFCGASTILSSRISKEMRPEYIIPFKKTKEDCKKAYARKMRFAPFAPGDLKQAEYIDGFRGIYMPYWNYQIRQERTITLPGEKSYRKGDYVYTEHYRMLGDLKASYDGFSKDASANFYDNISEALAPYDAKEMVDFTPSFLSGFYADTADVGDKVYREEVMQLAAKTSYEKIRKEPKYRGYHMKPTNKQHNLVNLLGTECREADRTMYPVWFMSYRNKDRVAYMTVNGQTGKVVADIPIEPKKYVLWSLVLAVMLFVLLNIFVSFTAKTILMLSGLMVFVSVCIYSGELKEIYIREHHKEDLGIQERLRKKREEKRRAKEAELRKDNPETVTADWVNYRDYAKEEPVKKNAKVKQKWGFWQWFRLLWPIALMVVSMGAPLWIIMENAVYIMAWPVILVITVMSVINGFKNRKKLGDIKEKAGFIISIVVVCVSTGIGMLNPVEDYYYYIGAIFSLLAVLYNMVDVIKNYNRLTMRKLPQFDKKGGDDRA